MHIIRSKFLRLICAALETEVVRENLERPQNLRSCEFHLVSLLSLGLLSGASPQIITGPGGSALINPLEDWDNACGTNGARGGHCGEVFEFADCTGPRLQFIKPDCSHKCWPVTDRPVVSLQVSEDGNAAKKVTCLEEEDEEEKEERVAEEDGTGRH
ncbi:hypothetical protein B0J14DRAFT_667287 [Halenospora varia]|nr:hypothetical protein B0J14DRAFT_667287 [Halenospora varia]